MHTCIIIRPIDHKQGESFTCLEIKEYKMKTRLLDIVWLCFLRGFIHAQGLIILRI